MEYSFTSHSKQTTRELGIFLAKFLLIGDVLTLTGDLGAGKTTLTQGLAFGLKIEDRVISPTFNIMKCYFKAEKPLFHIDAYRLEDANKDIGLEEFIGTEGIAVIEWPQYIKEFLPAKVLKINLIHAGGDERIITISGDNHHYDEIVQHVKGVF